MQYKMFEQIPTGLYCLHVSAAAGSVEFGERKCLDFRDRQGPNTVSVLIPTDFRHGWAIFGPLADKNTWKGVLLELPATEKFSGLFLYMFWDISLKLGRYI